MCAVKIMFHLESGTNMSVMKLFLDFSTPDTGYKNCLLQSMSVSDDDWWELFGMEMTENN